MVIQSAIRRKEAEKRVEEKRVATQQIRLCVYQKVFWDPLVKTVIAKIVKKLTDEERAAIQQVYLRDQKSVPMTTVIAYLPTRTTGKPRKKRIGDSAAV